MEFDDQEMIALKCSEIMALLKKLCRNLEIE